MARLGLTLAAVAMMFAGCSQFAKQGELDRSLATWQALKAGNGGHYQYETHSHSWTGASSVTTFEVQDNVVFSRAYEGRYDNDEGEEIVESWTEEGAEVGAHEAGWEPRTIDELYSVCRNEVLIQNAYQNELYLEFRNDEVLATCQYRPLDCVDDCLFGVSVDALTFLPTKND